LSSLQGTADYNCSRHAPFHLQNCSIKQGKLTLSKQQFWIAIVSKLPDTFPQPNKTTSKHQTCEFFLQQD